VRAAGVSGVSVGSVHTCCGGGLNTRDAMNVVQCKTRHICFLVNSIASGLQICVKSVYATLIIPHFQSFYHQDMNSSQNKLEHDAVILNMPSSPLIKGYTISNRCANSHCAYTTQTIPHWRVQWSGGISSTTGKQPKIKRHNQLVRPTLHTVVRCAFPSTSPSSLL
jgi:hypothetical protein